ncbi:MAG: hypothetical protein FWG14_11175, partial [Peptococcaceae bacterium]|nr:hypothetical protein [Peptococcaceae bacterium]
GLAKSIAKMLGKTGTGIKAGTGWLLDVVVSAASKTRNAAASAMSAFQNRCGKLSKKAFSGTGTRSSASTIASGSIARTSASPQRAAGSYCDPLAILTTMFYHQGYIVPSASHPAVTSNAGEGRLPQTELRVLSL